MAEAPQTCLVTAPVVDTAVAIEALKAALARGGKVASLLLHLAPADERARVNLVKTIAPVAQEQGIAVLVADDLVAATRGGADGVHITTGLAAIREAVQRLKPDRIVGAGNLRSRHEAMEAGEAGVDYVMFGEPVGDRPPPSVAAVEERARWWADVFQIPGVAFAPDDAAAARLAATGIDFIARPM